MVREIERHFMQKFLLTLSSGNYSGKSEGQWNDYLAPSIPVPRKLNRESNICFKTPKSPLGPDFSSEPFLSSAGVKVSVPVELIAGWLLKSELLLFDTLKVTL